MHHEIAVLFGAVYFAANMKLEGEQERRIPTFGDAHGIYLGLCVGKFVVSLCVRICCCFD